jgi:AcrR family transcriptional regulator
MRRNIIEVAAAIVVEKGAAALTTEEVARRADVSVQTVYNRVGGQPALLIAITELALEENRGFMDAAYAGRGTPAERIERAGLAYASFALQRPHAFSVLLNPPDEAAAMGRVTRLIHEQNGKLAAALRDGQQAGGGRTDLDPDCTATVLWAMMNGILNLATRTDALHLEGREMASVIETAMAIIRSGLIYPSETVHRTSRSSAARATTQRSDGSVSRVRSPTHSRSAANRRGLSDASATPPRRRAKRERVQ